MDNLFKTIEYKGYNINIYHESDPQNPREWDHIGTIYSNNRYYNPDNRKINEIFEQECYQNEDGNFDPDKFSEDYVWLRVYAYIHSGITISCRRSGQYADRWDSGLFGIIAVEKSVAMKEYGYDQIGDKERKIIECHLEYEIKELDDYYTGEVYGYTITKVDDDGDEQEYDSCWDYYGDDKIEAIETECKFVIDKI